MKDYSNVKFIKIVNNDDNRKFYIDTTTMNDYRLRVSALKGQYYKYLETGNLYRELYELFVGDFSFYCIEKGKYKNLRGVQKRKSELVEEHTLKLKDYIFEPKSATVTFNLFELN